ncbi:MAG: cyclic nucleotide-binding domain-containing protein [Bacteroidia bacterium]|nr:MAG: cyclic nucleotide-binding domain-containing protein [Bacteroidia bacterium]
MSIPILHRSRKSWFFRHFGKRSIKRRLISNRGDTNNRHYIIEKGLLRLYLIDYSGKEFNIIFAKENQIIGDLSTPQASNYFLETIEPSTVWSMDDRDMKRLVSLLSNTADENYRKISAEFLSKIIARSFS